jgi:hypothetical protein
MMKDALTAFERFERRVFWRALLIFVGGGIGLALLRSWLFQLPWLGLALMVCWLAASWFAAAKLRQRHEAVAAYKARVGYKDSP